MRPRSAILIAAGLVYVIGAYVPLGHEVLYPLTLFTTWVHEMGHGLTALVLGGRFSELEIFSNASGLAACYAEPGWREALVSLGGLLAPPIVGAAIIATVHGPRRARVALAILAGAIVLSLVIWVRSTTGVIAMPVVAALLGYAAWRGWFGEAPERRVILAQVLGVVLALDTLTRMISYVFTGKVEVGGKLRASDISNVADNLGGHYVLWGIVVTVIAVALLGGALWWAWRRPAKLPA
jgi:peptidase M50B-like protein